jgi:hypothetical protein
VSMVVRSAMEPPKRVSMVDELGRDMG